MKVKVDDGLPKLTYQLPNLPLHGVRLSTTHNRAPINTDLPFNLCVTNISDNGALPKGQKLWSMTDKGDRYVSEISLYRDANTYTVGVKCEGNGLFIFEKADLRIDWQSQGTGFEHYFQSIGLAFWLEQQGIPCLHANTVSLNQSASLIIAPSRTGKSTLTTHLLQCGFKMMTDDMAAIHLAKNSECLIYPSWPRVRLWPDVADSFIGTKLDSALIENEFKNANNININELDSGALLGGSPKRTKVHQKFAKYQVELGEYKNMWEDKPHPLKAIYYLDRQEHAETKDNITPIKASAGLMMLLQNSILGSAYSSMQIESSRLKILAALLEKYPMFKITYRSGLDNLPNVGAMIKQHQKTLS